ncbi:MAG: bifunctional diguanylate cyclase/phosphodiesterase [Halomonadaceae bacterium]|nr:MAG: bifunctional diguanylate cyclase/phosphodiesterase [Halomonadaceae bacterium]
MGKCKALGFRGRLMLAMLTLVIVTSVSIAGLMMLNLFEEEKARADRQLEVAENVARQTIESRTQLVTSSLEVVVQDFGFKSAMASRDLATITSALENHAARAGADLAMLTDAEGQLIANLQGLDNNTPLPFQQLLDEAHRLGAASQMHTWQEEAYQILIVPVRGPGIRGWLVAGFQLNDGFAGFISKLTQTDILFTRGSHPGERLLAGSLDESLLEVAMGGEANSSKDLFNGSRYFTRSIVLGGPPELPINLLVLTDRADAMGSYYRLALETLILVLIALTVAALLVLLTARALVRPVLELADFAVNIGDQRDVTPPPNRGGGEISLLRRALINMRLRIINRENRITHSAYHDDLTGLPNRKFIERQLQSAFEQQREQILLGFSIGDFHAINETLGFHIGDQLIIATALRLKGLLPPSGTIARTGGKEFIALLPAMEENPLQQLITTLRSHCESSMLVNESPIKPQLIIAALTLPQDAQSLDEVRRRINLTLKNAEHNGQRFAVYESGGDELHLRELRLIRDLELAIEQGDLYMNYQPKIELKNMAFVQVEALVRWRHPELGFINPEEFITLAERSGQTQELTHFIMGQIARDSAAWHRDLPHIGVAINLSALDLGDSHLPDTIESLFSDWHDRMDRLTFEITESALMQDAGTALNTLHRLRKIGVNLSVDDFGTGYSSLAQLRQLPVTELKIDKSFVLKLNTQSQDQLIVKSTIELAHSLGLSVVAEGIENEPSLRMLQSWGCEKAQGFFMARPMPGDQLMPWADEFARLA